MSRRLFILTSAIVFSWGCVPPPKPVDVKPDRPATRMEKVAGAWTGKVPESEDKALQGPDSNFLAEQLGGYTLELDPEGTFAANWRGLTRDGTWKIEGDDIVLKVEKVLGKSRSESKSADLPHFEQDARLVLDDGDQVLKLTKKDDRSLPLVFRKE